MLGRLAALSANVCMNTRNPATISRNSPDWSRSVANSSARSWARTLAWSQFLAFSASCNSADNREAYAPTNRSYDARLSFKVRLAACSAASAARLVCRIWTKAIQNPATPTTVPNTPIQKPPAV